MKIGFEAKRIIQNKTGLGNYSRYIVEILSAHFPDNSYILFSPKDRKSSLIRTILSRSNISFVFPKGVYKRLSAIWRIFGMTKSIRENEIDVFHGLSNELPVGIAKSGSKSVVTIHDLIFLRFPQYYKFIDRLIYTKKFKYACENADKVIAVSECTKRDIMSFFNISDEKIEVIYQGCHSVFSKKVDDESKQAIRKKHRLPAQFLLNVGSIEERKNLLLLAKALKFLPEHIHLVAVGKSTPYQHQVEEFARKEGLSSRVHIFNAIELEDLPAFYQLADIFIYPSFFEGFGIPVIEALSCEVPVIAATGSCLEEAGGPNSIYINPHNEKELAEKINLLIQNPDLRKEMIDAGKMYVKKFSDEKIATQLMNLYQHC